MEGKLKDIVRYQQETDTVKLNEDKEEILSHLHIFKNEIDKEIRYQDELIKQGGYEGSICESMPNVCAEIENLSLDKFNENTELVMTEFLLALKENYMNTYLAVEHQKDSIQKLYTKPDSTFMNIIDQKKEAGVLTAKNHKKVRKLGSKLLDIAFTNFRNEHKNKALEDFVTAATSLQFTDEDHNNIIQKKDPIYLLPYDNDWMRSHFYAPEKKIFGTYIDTFWANVIVIWLMTLLLTLTLFLNAFKFIIDLIGIVMGFGGKLVPSVSISFKKGIIPSVRIGFSKG
jgi:hypothetical protein